MYSAGMSTYAASPASSSARCAVPTRRAAVRAAPSSVRPSARNAPSTATPPTNPCSASTHTLNALSVSETASEIAAPPNGSENSPPPAVPPVAACTRIPQSCWSVATISRPASSRASATWCASATGSRVAAQRICGVASDIGRVASAAGSTDTARGKSTPSTSATLIAATASAARPTVAAATVAATSTAASSRSSSPRSTTPYVRYTTSGTTSGPRSSPRRRRSGAAPSCARTRRPVSRCHHAANTRTTSSSAATASA